MTLKSPGRQHGQSILRLIVEKLRNLAEDDGPEIEFRWVPAHSGVKGNEKPNTLARLATSDQAIIPPRLGCTVASSATRKISTLGREALAKAYAAAKGGRHTRDLDKALPGRHTKVLYDRLTRPKATVLAQLGTGKCKLKSYLYAIKAEGSNLCECGQIETVKHVVLDCRKWSIERRELRAAVKDKSRWGDLSYLLGGWSGRKDLAGKYIEEKQRRGNRT